MQTNPRKSCIHLLPKIPVVRVCRAEVVFMIDHSSEKNLQRIETAGAADMPQSGCSQPSILVEHPLNLPDVVRSCQCEHRQYARLLWRQGVSDDKAEFIVAILGTARHQAVSHPARSHNDNTLLARLDQSRLYSGVRHGSLARTGKDNRLRPGCYERIDGDAVHVDVPIDDIDLWQHISAGYVEFRFDRVFARRDAVEMRNAIAHIPHEAEFPISESVRV